MGQEVNGKQYGPGALPPGLPSAAALGSAAEQQAAVLSLAIARNLARAYVCFSSATLTEHDEDRRQS